MSITNTRPLSACSSTTCTITVPTPLTSPTEDPRVWDTFSQIIESDEAIEENIEDEVYTIEEQTTNTTDEQPTQSKISRKKKRDDTEDIKETLTVLTDFVKLRNNVPLDKNIAFGQYVAVALSEMPIQEQNSKKIKIMEVLSEIHE